MPGTDHFSSAVCSDPNCDDCASHAHITTEYDDYEPQVSNEFDY